MTFTSTNPYTGETIEEYDAMSAAEVDDILTAAVATQPAWAERSFDERAACLRNAARGLRENAGRFAERMAGEMGKPLSQGEAEIEKCAWVCSYYAEHGAAHLADMPVEHEDGKAYVAFRPLGAVLAVMPWNFPFWQVFRFAAPTLMAGNAGLLKHAANVQGCAIDIESVLHEAGVPEAVFRTLRVPSDDVAALIARDEIAAVTLTGSTGAGRAVGAAAGKAIKKSVLELGGSDPYVVLEDADVGRAVETCVASRLINGGQSCIAAKRFVVVEAVAEEFTSGVVEAMRAKRAGDPREDVDLGPMARADLRDELHEQVEKSVAAGARLLLGGEMPDGPGAMYPPTVLGGVAPGMPAHDEELFGPVAAIVTVKDEDEAVEVANGTSFGLGAAVFTKDRERGERIARDRLHAGCCFVNDFVKSDPRLPFGGVRESGYGRELGEFGIREFVNAKTVFVGSCPDDRGS